MKEGCMEEGRIIFDYKPNIPERVVSNGPGVFQDACGTGNKRMDQFFSVFWF